VTLGVKARPALLALVVLSLSACAPTLKDLKPALSASESGVIPFATAGTLVRSADGARFVLGDPVIISGDLTFPAGTGPFPAVVLAHGCGGLGNAEAGWAPVLREWGYATFVIDSLRGRNLGEICTNATTLTGNQRIPDAYGALRIVSTHPRIDAGRVALMGFSHGAILTMGASTVWARQTFASAGKPAFRAFFAFYPYCNTVYPERERISGPLRIHTGELDDWTPAGPCAQLVEILKSHRQDAMITVYPGAHHSFDNLGLGRRFLYLPNVDSAAGCVFRADSILEPLPLRKLPGCWRKGGTVAWNPEATEQARRNVQGQLAQLLK